MLGNCDVIAVFRTSSRNAQFFGEFLPDIDPGLVTDSLRRTGKTPTRQETRTLLTESLQRLPNRQCYWYDRRRPYRAVRLRVPHLPQPHEAIGISAAALEAFIDAEGLRLGGVAVSKATLRHQIEARRARLQQLMQPPVPERRTPAVETSPDAIRKPKPGSTRKPRLG